MRGKSLTTEELPLNLHTYGVGQTLPVSVEEDVAVMFREHYHRYHYEQQMLKPDKTRIVASIEGGVVGFCSVSSVNGYGVLSHLLVDNAKQGLGIGRAMEAVRRQICARDGLIAYSSCVTVGVQSQRLKLRNGLVPINVKFGYRQNVFKPCDITSAVTFTTVNTLPAQPQGNHIELDGANRRVRVIAKDPAYVEAAIALLRRDETHYADFVVDTRVHQWLLRERKLSFQGLDILVRGPCWGYLWQMRNAVYRAALASRNEMIAAPEEICRSAHELFSLSTQAA